MPKISVLMSVYNGEKYLREAIDSILSQTFKDFEFLIVNDASKDSSKEIILSYKDPRIMLIDNKHNMGLTRSLNIGMQLAKGEYIARQDADDISHPGRFKKQVEYLNKNENVGLLGCGVIEIDECGAEKLRWKLVKGRDLIDYIAHGSAMFRTTCIKKVGNYREEFMVAQDKDLWCRIMNEFDPGYLDEYLYKLRRENIAASVTQKNRILQRKFAQLAKELAEERKLKDKDKLDYLDKRQSRNILPRLTFKDRLQGRILTSNICIENAFRYLENGDKKNFYVCLWQSIRNNPFRYYAWVYLIENLLGIKSNKNKKMKVAFIVNVFPSLSETFILNQITGLIDLGHDVDIFAQRRGSDGKIHPDVSNYNLMQGTHLPVYIPVSRAKRLAKAILLILKKAHIRDLPVIFRALKIRPFGPETLYKIIPFLGKKFDILQCHFGPNGNFGIFLKNIGVKGKLITMFHGYDIRLGITEGNSIYRKLFEKGDCFLAHSEYSRGYFSEAGVSAEKIIVHPVGVDIDKFSYSSNGRHKNIVRILTIARLVEEKGISCGIMAFDKLLKNNPGTKLEYRIIGAGPLEEELKKLSESAGLSKTVNFIGSKHREGIIEELRQADIFLLPSIAEGLPVSVMEAQAVGLPVVATSVGSVSEVVINGRTGFVVLPEDTNALAERLQYLIEHPEIRVEFGKNGRKHIEENYDITKLNKKLESIYAQLLKD